MKILFVMPHIGAWATHGLHKAPNQFYAQLAAYVRQKKLAEVSVLDARALDLSTEDMLKNIKEAQPDIVVLGEILHSTGGLAVIWHFNETAKHIKEILPQAKIVVGGLWYSALFKETLAEHPYIDFVLIGEPELTFAELILGLDSKKDLGNIAGLARRKNGAVAVGGHRQLIPNLDILPLPAYDLFPMDKYVGHTYWKPFSELMTSRGCPGGCSFCYEWSQYDPRSTQDFVSWRARSGKRVADELELLEKKFGVKVVVFQDDAFNVDRINVEETCNEIIQRNLKINWVILGRADDWAKQRDLIPLMKKAGMFMGLVGIEVSSDEELAKLGKGITTSQIKETITALRQHDIATVGTVLIGLDDDSEDLIKKRFAFTDLVDPDIMAIDFVTPVPGSPVWKKLVKEGRLSLKDIDLKIWDFHHPVVPTKYLSVQDVGSLGAWCMKEFFKPARINRIMQSNYPELVKLCVQDFMSNIKRFEGAATKGELYV